MRTITTRNIQSFKNKKKIVMITAYDALFARLFDEYVDIILVGDSLNMSFGGQKDTIKDLGIQEMIYHAKAVCRGSSKSMVVLDMPFGTYTSKKQALKNATMAMKQSDISAIKIEGGKEIAKTIKHLTQNSIAVMGHIGLLPQNVRLEGGYQIKGKDTVSTQKLIDDAKAIRDAGAFAIVCEGIISSNATQIAKSVDIPVIGIGCGKDMDGQVLVFSDMLGLFDEFTPKFVRKYIDGASLVKQSIEKYAKDIQNGDFPSSKESYE